MIDVIKWPESGGATLQVASKQIAYLGTINAFIDLSEDDVLTLLEQLHDKYPTLVEVIEASDMFGSPKHAD